VTNLSSFRSFGLTIGKHYECIPFSDSNPAYNFYSKDKYSEYFFIKNDDNNMGGYFLSTNFITMEEVIKIRDNKLSDILTT
jgi:hypothetical protein